MDFEKLPDEELGTLLEEFYCCARTRDNKEYSKSGLKGIRAGLQRHLEGKPWYRKCVISTDKAFMEANQAFNGVLAKLKKDAG